MSDYYPIFLDLRERLAVVVGSGAEASRRVPPLLASGARVRLVAATPSPGVVELGRDARVELRARGFRRRDLRGASLAICEREAPGVEVVWHEAQRRRVPLNVIDDPARCSFIAPAVVRRGDLVVAISTAGCAPALAVRLREELERRLGEGHARFLALARRLRRPLAARVPDFAARRALWYRLVDSPLIPLLARGRTARAEALVLEIAGVAPEPVP
jgi:siroheme synthase-like protein